MAGESRECSQGEGTQAEEGCGAPGPQAARGLPLCLGSQACLPAERAQQTSRLA